MSRLSEPTESENAQSNTSGQTTDKLIWTIGHSRHEIPDFVSILQSARIQVVADVRSAPYSRIAPQFNQEPLRAQLAEAGIDYVFLGRELGGRPAEDHMYDDRGRVFYNLLAETPLFKSGIERMVTGARRFRIALLCSEGSPDGCHRNLLVARVLQDSGFHVRHLLPDGSEVEATRPPAPAVVQDLFGDVEVEEWKSAVSVRQAQQPNDSSHD